MMGIHLIPFGFQVNLATSPPELGMLQGSFVEATGTRGLLEDLQTRG